MPADQRVEGGVQVRVTADGLDVVTAALPGIINAALGSGLCVPETDEYDLFVASASACNDPTCSGGRVGCDVDVALQSVETTIVGTNVLQVDVTIDADARVPVYVDWPWPLSDSDCEMTAEIDNARVVGDIRFTTPAPSGELVVTLQNVRALDLGGLIIDGSDCGTLGDIFAEVVEIAADALSTQLGEFLVDQFTPALNSYIQGFLPDPLGIEGRVDLHAMIGRGTPEEAALEVSAVAGGYVSLPAQGLSLGMIVGLNADENPVTRGAGLASESARCVPARLAPDLSLPPASLTRLSRGSFRLPAAEEFIGNPDPAATDVAIGISETVLDQAGHHAVTSGALCLGIGTAQIPQITLGTLGLLIPSLGDLGEADDPLLLVLRPQQPIDATIGDGTADSPIITLGIRELEIDVYAWVDQRYTRGFTIKIDLDAGVNLGFGVNAAGESIITPELVGIDSEGVTVTIENAELLREDPAEIAAIFPALIDLIIPQLGGALPGLALPALGGFEVTPTSIHKVTTTSDEFVAVFADLGAGSMARVLEASAPWSPKAVEILARSAIAAAPAIETTAEVVAIRTPEPAAIRAALAGRGGALPEVELALGADRPGAGGSDGSAGRGAGGPLLEFQWALDGGMWRTFSADPRLIVRDRSLALQGRHTIAVRARAIGDHRSIDRTPILLDVIIDSVPPELTNTGRVEDDTLVFGATDLVTSDGQLEWAVGDPDGDGELPADGWITGGRFTAAQVTPAVRNGRLLVFVRDEAGNVTRVETGVGGLLAHHGTAASGEGCECRVGVASGSSGSSGSSNKGGLVLVLLGAVGILSGRGLRARLRAWAAGRVGIIVGAVLVSALGVACGDSETGGPGPGGDDLCELATECTCEEDRVPICNPDGSCGCLNELVLGEIGRHADIGVGPGGTAFVSAYNDRFGDLMVAPVVAAGRVPDDAWEFVDGVPDGPVAVEGSRIRGGIQAPGDDVGLQTSLAVGSDSEPRVAYHDATNRSLRFAHHVGGAWVAMDVDAGSIADGEFAGEAAGRSPALTLADDGTPGIAYQAVVSDAEGSRAEVRWAIASSPAPSGPNDWTVVVVASAPLPELDDGEDPPVDLENELGIFVAAARKLDGTPFVTYYDRPTRRLRAASWDATAGAFAQPITLDGGGSEDRGWYPSTWIGADDVPHVAYVDAQNDDLLHLAVGGTPDLVDDGYREDGVTSDGIPRPVFHFVGDDSAVMRLGTTTVITYQDATTQELLLATRPEGGEWERKALAGAESPFKGAYGFYASAELAGADAWIATTVYDPPNFDQWVEVFVETLGVE